MRSYIAFALVVASFLLCGCKRKTTCTDEKMNQGEVQADCGGPCKACPTCVDGIRNQGEPTIDCGGPCPPCITCSDGIRNQGEENVDCGGPCGPCPVIYPTGGKWGSSIIRPDSLAIISFVSGNNASYYSMRVEAPKGNKVMVEMQNTTEGSNAIWYYYPSEVESWNIDTYDYVNNVQRFTVDATYGLKSGDIQMYFSGSGSATIKVFENDRPDPVRVRYIKW